MIYNVHRFCGIDSVALNLRNIAAKISFIFSFKLAQWLLITDFKVQFFSVFVALDFSKWRSMVDCFSTKGAVSLLDLELFGLKKFCIFDKTFDSLLDDNTITLWPTLHWPFYFAYASPNNLLTMDYQANYHKTFLAFLITPFSST